MAWPLAWGPVALLLAAPLATLLTLAPARPSHPASAPPRPTDTP